MTSCINFKDTLVPVQSSTALIDTVLSKTQRKTPTIIHPQFKITRIRGFYMRKIKFTQSAFKEKLEQIISSFPKLDSIHPFYRDLCNVLYDRDHYKIALGQIKSVSNLVDRIAKDYVKLVTYADSPYKCKMLKRAALGRMCTAVKKTAKSLDYLEDVRQHLCRLPAIVPNYRTLILTGFPNVGKSSFMNIVSAANVDVQPYAFTTKSIFVGHFDYNFSRWQIVDTPGLLDNPDFENRNTIEMTAITALAHLNATVCFVIDLSETCGYTIASQVDLFKQIFPLFKNKPICLFVNKIDLKGLDNLTEEEKNTLEEIHNIWREENTSESLDVLPISCLEKQNIDHAKNRACDLLLNKRLDDKTSTVVDKLKEKIYVANPTDFIHRPPVIPENFKPIHDDDIEGRRINVDETQEENGGAGVYSVDLRRDWDLENTEEAYDEVPELMDGLNVADFIDEDVEKLLRDLEEEERIANDEEKIDIDAEQEWEDLKKELLFLSKKRAQVRLENRMFHGNNGSNKINFSRVKKSKLKKSAVIDHLDHIGKFDANIDPRCSVRVGGVADMKDDEAMDTESSLLPKSSQSILSKSSIDAHSKNPRDSNRSNLNLAMPRSMRAVAERKRRSDQKVMNKKINKRGEGDRQIHNEKPRHLFSGKRSNGTTDWR